MKYNSVWLLILGLISLLIVSCTNEDDPGLEIAPVSLEGVYIVNEGVWGSNNASLSYFNPDSSQVYNHVFAAANDESALGDIAQAMTIRGEYGYIVVNMFDKVEVIRLADNRRQTTIQLTYGFSPRNITFVDETKAYLSGYNSADTSGSIVGIIDLETHLLSGTIEVGDYPEEIAIVADKAYVANSGWGADNTVSVINTANDQVVGSITVGDNPVNLRVDENGHLLVLCWGDYFNDTPGRMMVIDPLSDTVIDSILIGGHPSDFAVDLNGTGYFIGRDQDGNDGLAIASFSTVDYEILNETFITAEYGNFYAIAVDPGSGDIFVSTSLGFATNGEMAVYGADGLLKEGPFEVGIFPGSFAFVIRDEEK